jgi:hypothetical protein
MWIIAAAVSVAAFRSAVQDGSPSGLAMPRGDLPGWRQIFADDFTDDAPVGQFHDVYGARWDAYPDGWPNTAGSGAMSRYYPSRVVSAQDGMLHLDLHSESLAGTDLAAGGGSGAPGVYALTAALQPAEHGQPINQVYGKYTVRFHVDPAPGFYAAWLLWPQSEHWPYDGEISFPEGHLTDGVCGFMHHAEGTDRGDQEIFCPPGALFSPGWHTASTEWTPSEVRFILDGAVVGATTARIPHTPMRYVFQNEACWEGCPSPGQGAGVDVDWFVMYAYTP